MANLTAEEVTNWYLYAQRDTPTNFADDRFIRPANAPPIHVPQDLGDYMSTGAGRFAIGSQFAVVQSFFSRSFLTGNYQYSLPPNTYTQRQWADQIGINTPAFTFLLIFRERDISDGGADYAERTYIWNSVAFQIDDQARFVIDTDGTRHIENFRILPFVNQGEFENFDFVSADTIASIGGRQLQLDLDPFNIGRRVNFDFTGQLPTRSYREANYTGDAQRASTWFNPGSGLASAIRGLENKLFNQRIAPALDGDKPVIYGTNEADALSVVSLPTDQFYLQDFRQNGVVIVGGRGDDQIGGSPNDDSLFGGMDNDTLLSGAGADFMDGGNFRTNMPVGDDGTDTTDYRGAPSGVVFDLTQQDPANVAQHIVVVQNDGYGSQDTLHSIERVILTDPADKVIVSPDSAPALEFLKLIDADTQLSGEQDELDLSGFDEGIEFKDGKIEGYETEFKNFEKFDFGEGDDTVSVPQGQSHNIEIDLGGGDDTLLGAPQGSEIFGGSGNDSFELTKNVLIADAEEFDKVTYFGKTLTGGVQWGKSESPWAKGRFNVRYAIDTDGELVIEDPQGRQMFISNFDADADPSFRTAGIFVVQIITKAYRIFEIPDGASVFQTWEAYMGDALAALTGKSYFGTVHTDPLVLDLDGDGIELSSRLPNSPSFDLDKDGFAEEAGWVRGGDGLLVRDLNQNGKIDDVSELFGSEQNSGFTALAALDGNHDGKVDTSDNGLADFNGDGTVDETDTIDSLMVWRDLNANAVTDPGELLTLADLGIASISVQSTPAPAHSQIAGNPITATATFTRADGTTGTIADAQLHQDDFNTVWLGDGTISPEAQALPELKGYGTLTSLRVAATLDPDLITVVDNTLPLLDTTDLAQLRVAARPILAAWANAVPVPPGTAGTTPRPDFHVVTEETVNGIVVDDYLIKITDQQGTYWGVASGRTIKDADGNDIARPTQAQVLADPPPQGSWSQITGADIQFLERYLGDPIDLDDNVRPNQISAMNQVLDVAVHQLDKVVVRLAMQGPLAPFFAGLGYDPVSDEFRPSSDRQLAPMLEAIFAAAPATTQGATDYIAGWQNVLHVILPDLSRGGATVQASYSYLLQNLVAAYENVAIPLTLAAAASVFNLPQDMLRIGTGTVIGNNDEADLFYLGAGDETAMGGGGPDTYVVGYNFGHDTIQDVSATFSATDEDSIRFAHLNASDLTFTRDGLDLLITQTGTDNAIRVVDEFAGRDVNPILQGFVEPDPYVELIIFADGTMWDSIDIARAVRDPQPTSDTVTGTPSMDFLDPGAGDDIVSAGNGDDFYFFDRGYGYDIINENQTNPYVSSFDVLVFGDNIAPDDVVFSRAGMSQDLSIHVKGTDDSVLIHGQFDFFDDLFVGRVFPNAIEGFEFADGTTFSSDDVSSMLLQQASTGHNDVINGFNFDDTLDGGAGNDVLNGAGGNDTYVFGHGYGRDTIFEAFDPFDSGNQVQFTHHVAASDIEWFSSGTDLIAHIVGTTDFLTINNELANDDAVGIANFHFSDGTTVTRQEALDLAAQSPAAGDTITGTSFDDTVESGAGNDLLEGFAGDDTYVYRDGDGFDVIYGVTSGLNPIDNDKLLFPDILSTQVEFTALGSDLVIDVFGNSPGRIRLLDQLNEGLAFETNIKSITFADGMVLTADDIKHQLVARSETDGNDDIRGFNGVDTLQGGLGDDYLNALAGNDVYVWSRGDGRDTIQDSVHDLDEKNTLLMHGVAPHEVTVRAAPLMADSLELAVDGSRAQSVVLYQQTATDNIARIVFDDGTVW
ncbi:MAG: hypothetical protein QOG74_2610, partial [Alphaproteobacteria bacterium]|nr:hypothetical protein [Alphaproteobacteria bacterium]